MKNWWTFWQTWWYGVRAIFLTSILITGVLLPFYLVAFLFDGLDGVRDNHLKGHTGTICAIILFLYFPLAFGWLFSRLVAPYGIDGKRRCKRGEHTVEKSVDCPTTI